ncbi:MAG TPA: GAF domain-containing SpoIIE family protein phosphatase [Candidatus Marinimicrobia bacterium]|jgi:sigma-B regulation protein RsbU (phosphoserine phosphatase)|nr:GAF domain-containing SpoIIE family protein phosphatase [Candidatus Neomarinimicrobiota bacterium]
MPETSHREVRNLNALLEVSRALGAEMHLDSLLPVIIHKTTEMMDAERSSLFIYDPESDELWSKVAEGMGEKVIRLPAGVGIAGDVAETLETANIPDAYDDPRFNPEFDKQTNFKTKSILCMPMTTRAGELIGVIEVLNKTDGGTFQESDEKLLEALCIQAGVAIVRARLTEAFLEKQRIEESLKLAADIQMGMLPSTFPAFPERNDFDLFAGIIPAKEVGGDFYDFFLIDKKHLCFVIGDVSGKGIPAALFMALTKTQIKASSSRRRTPGDVLFRANNDLCHENESGMFCTLFYGIMNTETGEVTYANAGHNPPYLITNSGEPVQIESTGGIALGVMEEMEFESATFTISKGDSIFLYTDGVNEAMNEADEEYSYERLEDYLKENSTGSITDMVDRNLESVKEFAGTAPQSDDITVLALRYLGE